MKSEKVTDIFGNEKVVHYDDYGNKVGESQVEKGFLGLGNERVVHYDANGNKTGESWRENGFLGLGEDRTVHYDANGHKTGESWQENGFLGLGEDRTVHYDDRGHKVSQTFTEKDFFGNEKQVTYDSYSGAKIGQYTDETPYYSRKASGDASGGNTHGGGSSGYSGGCSGGYSGGYSGTRSGGTIVDFLAGLATLVLIALPFIMYFATKNSTNAVGLIRTAAIGVCPVITLASLIMFHAKRDDSASLRRDKRRMIISTAVLFLVQEICFLFYTDPTGEGDSLGSFILFVVLWIPKLIYSIVTGIFTFKSDDGDAVCRNCYRFASVAFAVISGAMELTNVISEGTLDDVLDVIILFIPAMAILCGAIYALTAATNWIYKKLAG